MVFALDYQIAKTKVFSGVKRVLSTVTKVNTAEHVISAAEFSTEMYLPVKDEYFYTRASCEIVHTRVHEPLCNRASYPTRLRPVLVFNRTGIHTERQAIFYSAQNSVLHLLTNIHTCRDGASMR